MYIKRILVAISLLGLLALAGFSYYVWQMIFSPNTSFEQNQVEVLVPTDATYTEVRKQLVPLVEDIESFDMVAQKKGYVSNIKSGRFLLQQGSNNNELINTLRSTNTPGWVTFNNQERIEDLAGRVAQQIEADSLQLLRAMKDSVFLSENGFDLANALNMYLPNKYEFFWNTSAVDFRERMLREYRNFWNEERLRKAEEIGLSPQEVMVIASVVQKETSQVDERQRVAGVYINRIENGWKLEADPTVIFAIKERTQNFDTIIKRVLYKDLELDSPYNTYKYQELPPGPIAMPDISSIDAVLNHEDHDYYFFVADVQNFGYHKFAKTLAQHNRNKRQYIEWINSTGIRR